MRLRDGCSCSSLTCCHTYIDAADQTYYRTQSRYTTAWPASSNNDSICQAFGRPVTRISVLKSLDASVGQSGRFTTRLPRISGKGKERFDICAAVLCDYAVNIAEQCGRRICERLLILKPQKLSDLGHGFFVTRTVLHTFLSVVPFLLPAHSPMCFSGILFLSFRPKARCATMTPPPLPPLPTPPPPLPRPTSLPRPR